MILVWCPLADKPVWANRAPKYGYRCTKCGQCGHSKVETK